MSCILFSKISYELIIEKSRLAREVLCDFNCLARTGDGFTTWPEWLFNLNVAAYRERYDDAPDSEIEDAALDTLPDYKFAEMTDWEDAKALEELFGSIEYQCSEFAEWHPTRARVETVHAIREAFAERMTAPEYKARLAAKEAERRETHKREVERLTAELRAKYPNAKPAGKMSNGARTAANLRAELKGAFPGVKFSVRSDGNSIDVNWTDGPADADVDAIASQYKAGDFDGMSDSYDHDASAFGAAFEAVCGRVRWVKTQREYSVDSMQSAVDLLCATHAAFENPPEVKVSDWNGAAYMQGDSYDQSRMVRELLRATDLRFA